MHFKQSCLTWHIYNKFLIIWSIPRVASFKDTCVNTTLKKVQKILNTTFEWYGIYLHDKLKKQA